MKENYGLYLILTDPISGYETCATAAVDCGVRYLQLRMKNSPREIVLKTALKLREITQNTKTRFIMNDDLDLAMQSNADGIHLGQDDMTLAEARKKWNRPDKLFGLSTHSMEQAHALEIAPPDYIGIGPVFPTQTKNDTGPALGPVTTGAIATKTALTSVAIGGIHSGNLSAVLKAGSVNFCVVSAVNQAPDPAPAIRALQEIWKKYHFYT